MKLIRIEEGMNHTLGVLIIGNRFVCFTLELEWRDNLKNTSCIPKGLYKVERNVSARFGEGLKVLDVPDRTDILFHAGNTFKDTKGCILVGSSANLVQGIRFVSNSNTTLKEVLMLQDGVLEIC